jgi:hypothetical protein
MDKSNIAFALITGFLGVYIAVALLFSRVAGKDRGGRLRNKHKRSGPWTSFSS